MLKKIQRKKNWNWQPASTQEVAQNILAKYNSEEAKVRAIYNWVVSNIKYDDDSARIINAGIDPEARVTMAFKRRKGVCENFAAIFVDICEKAGIPAYIIKGYTKQNQRLDRGGHAWCAAKIDGKWFLFDPTWDEGNTGNQRFFMADPSYFIQTHMPFDPLWQLQKAPVSHEQFATNGFAATSPLFHYKDSIEAYLKMDSLGKITSALSRIEKMGLYNKRIKENYLFLKSHAEMFYQDEEVEYYNNAVSHLNEATQSLNQFINWRNEAGRQKSSDKVLSNWLMEVDDKINAAFLKLDVVDQTKAKLVLNTWEARERLQNLMKKNRDQQEFLTRYLNTPATERDDLFY